MNSCNKSFQSRTELLNYKGITTKLSHRLPVPKGNVTPNNPILECTIFRRRLFRL